MWLHRVIVFFVHWHVVDVGVAGSADEPVFVPLPRRSYSCDLHRADSIQGPFRSSLRDQVWVHHGIPL